MIIETFLQDLRIGLRVLVKEKSFCALAVFVLALGIAAVTTQYAVVNGVLLRGVNFRDADRLVDVQLADPQNFTPNNFNSRMTTADFADLKTRQRSFDAFVGYLNGSTVNLTYNGNPQRYAGGYITWDFFRSLGVAPVLGRDFLAEEDQPGVTKAVIISDSLWKKDFGGTADVIGKAVRVNGRAGVIVGVMPPKFHFPSNEQLWIPVNTEFPVKPRNDRGINFITAIGRLKPGVSIEQAEAELSAIGKAFAAEYPDTNKQFTKGYIRPLIAQFTGGQLNALLYTMLAFCFGVLLIACVNVMNMQFARAVLRAKELAIRSSLGATRVRLIRQMLTESLLLAALGAMAGIGLAVWATDYLNDYFHSDPQTGIPAWMVLDIDGMVLGVVLAATLLAAVVSGFVPAWMSSRANANDALKEGGRGNTSRTVSAISKGLVVFQILVTTLLLIGAGVMLQSIVRQQTINYGYDTGAVFGVRMGLMEGDYPTNERRLSFYQRLLRELRSTPQFEAVAYTSRLFRSGGTNNGPIEIEGREYKQDSDRPNAFFENVSPGYLDVLGVRLLEGRDFTDNDAEQKLPVAIVTASFAKQLGGGGSAVGRRFRTINPNGTQPGPWRVVVGVMPDIRLQGPFNNNQQAEAAGFFVPFHDAGFGPAAAEPQALQFGTVLARPRGGQRPESLLPALQAAVRKVDPNLPLYFTGTPKADFDRLLAPPRMVALMFAAFGAIAVVLASVGLYGVMSFAVNQRSQEFGVRMALGADAARILRMVFRQGFWQLALGLGLGLGLTIAIALAFRDPLTAFLFRTNPLDPLAYGTVTVLVGVVAFFAIYVPARRATRVDPMVALRAE
jgi:predicted permease